MCMEQFAANVFPGNSVSLDQIPSVVNANPTSLLTKSATEYLYYDVPVDSADGTWCVHASL